MDKGKILTQIITIQQELGKLINLVNDNSEQPQTKPKQINRTLKREPEKKKLTIKPSIEIKSIIDYWNNSGLRQHNNPKTKIYQNIVKDIKTLRSGKFFNRLKDFEEYKNREFTKEDFLLAIQNFSLAATNPDYLPNPGNYKTYLAKLSFSDFIYNGSSKNDKSYFIKFLSEHPELASNSGREIQDQNPKITKALKRFWNEKILGGVTPNFSIKEENDFRKTSNMLVDFFKNNRRKLNNVVFGGGRQEVELANMLLNSVIADIGENQISKLTSGWLCSDMTFSNRFPKYLHKNGLITK